MKFYHKILYIIIHFTYKIQLTNDTFSTLIYICDIFTKISNEQVHLNRFGTNPIEHDFGMIRMRSKDHHKAERFIQEASKINAIRQLRNKYVFLIDSIIKPTACHHLV